MICIDYFLSVVKVIITGFYTLTNPDRLFQLPLSVCATTVVFFTFATTHCKGNLYRMSLDLESLLQIFFG